MQKDFWVTFTAALVFFVARPMLQRFGIPA
jgi:hypothetical protein